MMKPAPAPPIEKSPRPAPKQRSRLSNGRSQFVIPVDGRTAPARRLRDLTKDFEQALPEPKRTAAARTLCRRAAAATVAAEMAEARMARAEIRDDAGWDTALRAIALASRLQARLAALAERPLAGRQYDGGPDPIAVRDAYFMAKYGVGGSPSAPAVPRRERRQRAAAILREAWRGRR